MCVCFPSARLCFPSARLNINHLVLLQHSDHAWLQYAPNPFQVFERLAGVVRLAAPVTPAPPTPAKKTEAEILSEEIAKMCV